MKLIVKVPQVFYQTYEVKVNGYTEKDVETAIDIIKSGEGKPIGKPLYSHDQSPESWDFEE